MTEYVSVVTIYAIIMALIYDLCIFVSLIRYIPPLTSSSSNLPETADEIMKELSKQESLLGQIHSEMNAGYVTKEREELLWEVQRMITQLKVQSLFTTQYDLCYLCL